MSGFEARHGATIEAFQAAAREAVRLGRALLEAVDEADNADVSRAATVARGIGEFPIEPVTPIAVGSILFNALEPLHRAGAVRYHATDSLSQRRRAIRPYLDAVWFKVTEYARGGTSPDAWATIGWQKQHERIASSWPLGAAAVGLREDEYLLLSDELEHRTREAEEAEKAAPKVLDRGVYRRATPEELARRGRTMPAAGVDLKPEEALPLRSAMARAEDQR